MKQRLIAHRTSRAAGTAILIVALALIAGTPSLAETAGETCDRLAADPAVKLEKIDAGPAAAACSAAVSAAPQTPRFAYQYARALEHMGRLEQARSMYQWAADDGLKDAIAALNRLASKAAEKSAKTGASERKQFTRVLEGVGAIAKNVAKTAAQNHDNAVAVIKKTGTDPAAILNWVMTNTRLVPYSGMLRGADGVLMDRAGNSLDRALLLGDLLHRAGHTVRIARATLSSEAAVALRAAAFAAVSPAKPTRAMDRAELLRQLGSDPRLDHALLEKSVDRSVSNAARFDASTRDLFNRVLPGVEKSLGDTSARDATLASTAEADLREHFWVERRVASGWEVLDPDGQIVKKLAPVSTFSLDQVPEELKQRVTLRLVLETWSAGKLTETKLLEKNWVPTELVGKSITINHTLLPQSSISQVDKASNPEKAYLESLTKAWVVKPEIQVGSETLSNQLYTMDGRVLPATNSTLAALGIIGFGNQAKIQSGLDAAFGGKSDKSGPAGEAQSAIRPSAEWLEFEITIPGHAPQKQRREIFDMIGSAARAAGGAVKAPPLDTAAKEQRALAISGTVDVYIFNAAPSSDWITSIAAGVLADTAEKSATLVRREGSLEDALAGNTTSRLLMPLWGWAINRQHSGSFQESAPTAPGIALFWQNIRPGAKSLYKTQDALDIVNNSSAADGDFKHRVAQGVFDTVVEHTLASSATTGGNTAALFAIDSAAGHRWALIDAEHAGSVQQLALSADVRARIQSDLAAGNSVLVPSAPVVTTEGTEVAWWRINPVTGDTLGISEAGLGAEMPGEAADLQWIAGKATCAFVGIGLMMAEREISVTSSVLMALCLAGPFHHGWLVIPVHGVLDAVIDMFANGMGPGLGGEHGGEGGEGGEGGGPGMSQPPPSSTPDPGMSKEP